MLGLQRVERGVLQAQTHRGGNGVAGGCEIKQTTPGLAGEDFNVPLLGGPAGVTPCGVCEGYAGCL